MRVINYGEFADAILDIFKHPEKYEDTIKSILPNDTEAGFRTGTVYAFSIFTTLSVPISKWGENVMMLKEIIKEMIDNMTPDELNWLINLALQRLDRYYDEFESRGVAE